MNQTPRLRLLYAAPGLVLKPGCGPCEHFLAVARGLAQLDSVELEILIGAPDHPAVEQIAGLPKNARVHLLERPHNAWAVTDSLALGSHPGRYLKHRKIVHAAAARILKDGPVDVVVERMWGFGGILGKVLQRSGSTWILEENGPPNFELRQKRVTDVLRVAYLYASRFRTRRIYRLPERIIVQSETLRERLRRQFGADSERISVINNAIDPSFLELPHGPEARTEARLGLNLPKERSILLYCGSFDRYHRVAELVSDFLAARFPQQRPLLLIIGTGYDQHRIENLIARKGRKNADGSADVRVLGAMRHAELARYLCAADLALSPYDIGNFPKGQFTFSSLKIREYLAFDLAVAATAGTTSDLVRDGKNGFLVPPSGSWRDLFERLPDQQVLVEMGRDGREQVSSYTYDDVARNYRELVAGQDEYEHEHVNENEHENENERIAERP